MSSTQRALTSYSSRASRSPRVEQSIPVSANSHLVRYNTWLSCWIGPDVRLSPVDLCLGLADTHQNRAIISPVVSSQDHYA